MPKRVIDFDAMWASDKMAACADVGAGRVRVAIRPRGLPPAASSCTNLRVIWGRVSAIRRNLTIERLEKIFERILRARPALHVGRKRQALRRTGPGATCPGVCLLRRGARAWSGWRRRCPQRSLPHTRRATGRVAVRPPLCRQLRQRPSSLRSSEPSFRRSEPQLSSLPRAKPTSTRRVS